MPRPLSEQVVVITGASSGIGREAALEFGRQGASVVIASRSWKPLRDTADMIEESGGKTYISVTDVSEWNQVEKLAETAVEYFGRIDTWINAAAVVEYAAVAEMSAEEIQRIIQVTMMGQIFGMKAAHRHMQDEGEGAIINISALLARRPEPLLAAYCAAMKGVEGFTESFRRELEAEGSGISLTTIVSPSVNTPLYEHARSKSGLRPEPAQPVYTPNVVAEALLFAAEHPRREIVVGSGGGIIAGVVERVTPRLAQYLLKKGDGTSSEAAGTADPESGESGTAAALDRGGNLFSPQPETDRTEGRYAGPARTSSPYTRIFGYHPALRKVAVAALVTGLGLVVRRVGRSRS